MKKKRLLFQLSIYNTTLVALFTVGIVFLVSRIISEYSYGRLHYELESYAKMISTSLPEDSAGFQEIARQGADATGCRITIINKGGEILADSHEDPGVMQNHQDRPEIITAFKGQTGSSKRFSDTIRTEMLYVAVPATDTVPTSMVVRCSYKATDISEWLNPFYQTAFLGAIGLGILGALAAYFVSRRITKPFEEIKERAAEIANGNFNKRLPSYPIGELDSLAGGINEMAQQLRQRMDELARQSEASKGILENMREAVISFDTDQNLHIVNASALELFSVTGSIESLIGKPFKEVFGDQALFDFADALAKEPGILEKDLILIHNDERFLKAFGSPLKNDEGTLQGHLLVFTDMTEIRRLENMRRDFVANVSHELKTPITAIQGAVEILEESVAEDEQKRFVDIAQKHSERLAILIQDILALSHIETPGRALEGMRAERADHLLEHVAELCREHAESLNKTLKVNCKDTICITMNPALMEQALVNLVDNAIKYSADCPEVVISCVEDKGSASFSVSDTGPGIPLPDQERIFERFYRVDKARSRKLGGTGLGLAIVKHIASLHSGTATVESQPGKGCTFTISIPADDA